MYLFRKKKLTDKFLEKRKKIEPEVKEAWLGRNTVTSLLGFLIGGVLVANTVWSIMSDAFGPLPTLASGIVLFILGGLALEKFRR